MVRGVVGQWKAVLVGVVVAAVTVGGPAVAATVVDFAKNADKVDGKHAVNSGTSVRNRGTRLVATNRAGYLPNNIIKKAKDANRLDGLDSSAFVRRGQTVENADAVDGIDSTALQSRTTYAALSRFSIPTSSAVVGYPVATARIAVPRGGGGLVLSGTVNPDYADAQVGTIGTVYFDINADGSCEQYFGRAWYDTYSVIGTSATATAAWPVPAGTHRVDLCVFGSDVTGDSIVDVMSGGLTVTWVPVASQGGLNGFAASSAGDSSDASFSGDMEAELDRMESRLR